VVDAIVEVADLHKAYGGVEALAGLNLRVPRGAICGLLGRNGAGKTTCMNTVIGFLRPRSGSVRVFGEPVERLAPDVISRKGIGLVPQGRRVFHRLTVRENLVVAQRKRGGAWNLDRVFGLFPRLRERQGQDAGSLSGGEQQMLAIARALMTNPQLLLLDEPLEGLAPIIVEELAASLANLEGVATILVEQHVEIALSLAQQALVIERGRIAHRGPSSELASNDPLLERYLGVRAEA
jgi:branched-chain amino acid transport system ATP-binding protein